MALVTLPNTIAEARIKTLTIAFAPVATGAVVLGAFNAYLPVGVLVAFTLMMLAMTNARTAAVLLALTSPLVAVAELDLGFKALPSYFVAAGGLMGIAWRREWRGLRIRLLDVLLLGFLSVAVAVSVGTLGTAPATTVVDAVGVNGPRLRSLAQLAALLAMGGMYALIRVAVRTQEDLQALIRSFAASFIVVGLIGIYQFVARLLDLPFAFVNNRRPLTVLPVDDAYVRINSTLPEASPLGTLCIIILLIALTRLWNTRRSIDIARSTAMVIAGLAGFVLLATLSKAAMLAALIAVGGLAATLGLSLGARRKLLVAATLTALVAAIALVLRNPAVVAHPGDVVRSEQYLRVGYWTTAVEITSQHPFGIGVGNYAFYYPRYAPLSADYEFAPGVADAHNWYLEALSETGVIGGMLFLAFALTTAWAPLVRRPHNPIAVTLGLGWTAAAVMHATYSYFYYPYEWVVAGAVGAALAIDAAPLGSPWRRLYSRSVRST